MGLASNLDHCKYNHFLAQPSFFQKTLSKKAPEKRVFPELGKIFTLAV
jgi:hypothetical protein